MKNNYFTKQKMLSEKSNIVLHFFQISLISDLIKDIRVSDLLLHQCVAISQITEPLENSVVHQWENEHEKGG